MIPDERIQLSIKRKARLKNAEIIICESPSLTILVSLFIIAYLMANKVILTSPLEGFSLEEFAFLFKGREIS